MHNYTKTDQILHLLTQTVAKANRTYVPKRPDDCHTNLYYDVLGDRVTGRWIQTPQNKVFLSLNLSTLQFDWIDDAMQIAASVSSAGKTIQSIEEELCPIIESLGLNPEGFTEKMHYQITEYPFAGDAIPQISIEDLNQWKSYRKLANEACELVLGYLQSDEETRIWPHHFDTGIYVPANERMGIGFGFAIEDEMAGAPYFYMAGYPHYDALVYENLPTFEHGHWEIHKNWQGAIFTTNDIDQLEGDALFTALRNYICQALHWYMK